MANKFWVGGTGNLDGVDTTHISDTSGGAGGAVYPGVGDTLIFDGSSGGGTVTFTSAATFAAITSSAHTGAIDTNGQTVALSGAWINSGSATRTLTLGASAISCNSWQFVTTTNLTFNANTSTITVNLAGNLFAGGGLTYATVIIQGSPSGTASMTGANTFGTLTITGPAASKVGQVALGANQIITGTFTPAGNSSTNRLLINSSTKGTTRTITAATVTASNIDLQDITGAGAGSWNLSAITGNSGDCGGNSGITFTAPATQYWQHGASASYNWSDATLWFLGSGGSGGAGRVPLPQDTARFDSNSFGGSGKTVVQDMPRIGEVDWTGTTNAPTFTTSTGASFFGSITLIAGMTLSASNPTYIYEGRGPATLTSAGKTWAKSFKINAVTGTLALGDAFNSTGTAATTDVISGTFNTNGYSIALAFSLDSGGSAIRAIDLGASTVTLSGDSNPINFSGSNLTFNAGTSTIRVTGAFTAARTFAGADLTFYDIEIASTGAFAFQFAGSNTFHQITINAGRTVKFTAATTTTFSSLTALGTRTSGIVIDSITAASHTLAHTGTAPIQVQYCTITNSTATGSGMIAHVSTNGGSNSGWTFPTAKFWVGGAGNTNDTAHWAATSGGASGVAVPSSSEDAVWDDQSNATGYTVTANATFTCNSILLFAPASGNVTLAGSNQTIQINGDMYLYSGLVNGTSDNFTWQFPVGGIHLVKSNGFNFGRAMNASLGGIITLLDNITWSGSQGFLLSFFNGASINTNGFDVTIGSTSATLEGPISFRNLTINGSADKTYLAVVGRSGVAGSWTVSGTLTIAGNSATNRILVQSAAKGSPASINAAAVAISNSDFQDITASGAANWNLSAITGLSGDCGGNSSITFTTPQTNYWQHGASASYNWSDPSRWFLATNGGGGAGRVPLPQDTARFDANSFAASGKTVVQDMPRIPGADWTGVTNTPTWTTSTVASFFGSIALVSGMTLTTSTQTYTYEGRGASILTSAGKTWFKPFTIDSVGTNSLTIADAFIISNAVLTLTSGTFNSNGFSVTVTTFGSTNSNVRTLTMGSSTWSITGTGSGNWNLTTSTNMTLNSGTSTIRLNGALVQTSVFLGGNLTYYRLENTTTGAFALQFFGSNTFTNGIYIDASAAARTVLFTAGTTTTVSSMTRDTGSNIITFGSITAANHNLVKTGSGRINMDYMSISRSQASPSTNTWYANLHSTDAGNNSGWIFGATFSQAVTSTKAILNFLSNSGSTAKSWILSHCGISHFDFISKSGTTSGSITRTSTVAPFSFSSIASAALSRATVAATKAIHIFTALAGSSAQTTPDPRNIAVTVSVSSNPAIVVSRSTYGITVSE